jgi:hypothetical protein
LTFGFRIVLAPNYVLMTLIRVSVTWGVTAVIPVPNTFSRADSFSILCGLGRARREAPWVDFGI